MKKISLLTFSVILFTSCSDIFFTSPQPEFAENLSEIPEGFQGLFILDLEDLDLPTSNEDSLDLDEPASEDEEFFFNIKADRLTIPDGSDFTIATGNLVVKSLDNYLFLNIKDSTGKWELLTILSDPFSYDEKFSIQYMYIESTGIDLGQFNNVDTIPADTITNPLDYTKYIILDEINRSQFDYLLKKSHEAKYNLIRVDEEK